MAGAPRTASSRIATAISAGFSRVSQISRDGSSL
jgi:hypothetical protein